MCGSPPIFAQEGEAAKTIIHCTFEKDGDTESWYASAADGSLATVSTTSGALKFSDKGKDDWEGPQYTLDGQLEADKTYEISFDAKSEEDVSIRIIWSFRCL